MAVAKRPPLGPECTANRDALAITLKSLADSGRIGLIDALLIETLKSAAGNTDAAITQRDGGRTTPVMVSACIKAQASLTVALYRQLVPKSGGSTDAERDIWSDLSSDIRDGAED